MIGSSHPLKLKHTGLPEPGETGIRGDHPRGYHVDTDGELRDITEADPSSAWAAGTMVSTPAELNTFMKAVLEGELLEPAELDQMLTGIPTGEELFPDPRKNSSNATASSSTPSTKPSAHHNPTPTTPPAARLPPAGSYRLYLRLCGIYEPAQRGVSQ